MTKLFFFEEFGKAFIPKKIRPRIRSYLLKAGIVDTPFKLFGMMFYLSLILTFFVYFLTIYPKFLSDPSLFKLFVYTIFTWIALPLGLTIIFGMMFYFLVDLKIFNRTRKMEAALPDFLKLVSENLKGGMPFERALWSSIRPEFGFLASEVRLAAKRVMTGSDVETALREFTSKYKSPTLRRSFDLIIEGMKGGGQISDLIDRVIETIEETSELKKEMTTTNLTYVIFISFVVIIIAPLLFALSYQFLEVIQGFSSRIGSSNSSSQVGLLKVFGQISVDPAAFTVFSRWALSIMSLFSAMIISLINTGTIRGGIKYIPIFLIVTQITYIFLSFVVGIVFGVLFGEFL